METSPLEKAEEKQLLLEAVRKIISSVLQLAIVLFQMIFMGFPAQV